MTSPKNPIRGEFWAIGMALGYATANIFDAAAVIHANPLVGPLLRGTPSLLLGLALVARSRTWGQLRPGSPAFIGWRAALSFVLAGLLSTVGLFVYYYAMRLGGVILTTPVLETYVIWGTMVAWFFLGEKFRGYVFLGWALILGGLAALSLGQYRGEALSHAWGWAIPLAAFTAVSYGISGVLWRDGQLRGAHQSTAIFLHFATSILVALGGLALIGRFSLLAETSSRDVGALLLSGVLSGIVGIYCMFTALRLMAVARVYAFSSLTPLIATLLARVFLKAYLNGVMLAGVVSISAGVVFTQVFRTRHEKQA